VELIDDFGIDEQTAIEFTEYMRKFPILYDDIANIIKQHIVKKNPVILDVGMGPGLLSYAIAKKISGSIIVGLDPVHEMVHYAYHKSQNRFSVVQGISERMPFCAGSIDVVVSRFSLPYWTNPQQSFQEINRLLHNDGLVILDVLNKDYSKLKLSLIKLRMYLRGAPGTIIQYHLESFKLALDFDSLITMMKNVGFTIESPNQRGNEWHYNVIALKNDNAL
jgi:ubiquinone/menaquinone biosynthesis C-methylase UbiE